MPVLFCDLCLPSPDATTAFATRLGQVLRAGDVVGLRGPVGAGKSHFSRALIQSLQTIAGQLPEDVPSPTFTLVQTYHAGGLEVWHCDLYRLGDPGEVLELGLDEAFETAACLVEWPDRLGEAWPEQTALDLTLSQGPGDDTRMLTLSGNADWSTRLKEVLA